LTGLIPDYTDWSLNVRYQIELEEIKELTDVAITQEDLDLAKMHGEDINQVKKDRLKIEKKTRLAELNKKYGIKTEDEDEKFSESVRNSKTPQDLWDILQGKGLTKKVEKDDKKS
jgi:hypothetical protein